MITRFITNNFPGISSNNINTLNDKKNKSKSQNRVQELEIKYQEFSALIMEKMDCARMQLDIITSYVGDGDKWDQGNNQLFQIEDGLNFNIVNQLDQNKQMQLENQIIRQPIKIQKSNSKLQSSSGSTFGTQQSHLMQPKTRTTIKQHLKNQQNIIQTLENTINWYNEQLSGHLLKKQVEIQGRNQLIHKLSNYQIRIRQLQQVLYRKQLQATVYQAVNHKNPKILTMKSLNNQLMQISNIMTMTDKINQTNKEIRQLQTQKQGQKQEIFKQITPQMLNRISSKKMEPIQQTLQEQQGKYCTIKKIIHLQEKSGVFDDPHFKKIIKIVKDQLKRQQILKKQYSALQKCHINLQKQINSYVKSLKTQALFHRVDSNQSK